MPTLTSDLKFPAKVYRDPPVLHPRTHLLERSKQRFNFSSFPMVQMPMIKAPASCVLLYEQSQAVSHYPNPNPKESIGAYNVSTDVVTALKIHPQLC